MSKLSNWIDKKLTIEQQASICGWVAVAVWTVILAMLAYFTKKQ